MIVTIAIFSIIMPVVYSAISSLYKTHAYTFSKALALSEATEGVQEVVRDVRGAVYAENGALPIVSMATSSLVLYTDTDFDGYVERVRYYLDGTTIYKGIVEPTSTSSYPLNTETTVILTEGVANVASGDAVFRYFTSTSTELFLSTDTLDVRRIEVLFVAESTFGHETARVRLGSSASIRNLKESY